MSFDSLAYLLFLPAVWLCYICLNRPGQNALLLFASYVFYGWWDERFLFLIVLSTSVDYCCGLLMENRKISIAQYSCAAGALTSAFVLFVVVPVLFRGGMTDGVIPGYVIWGAVAVLAFIIVAPIVANALSRRSDPQGRKAFLLTSVVTNLSILGCFKYFDFFVSSAEDLMSYLGVANVELLHLNVVLPVGISFYTFQTLSYSIGVYRREVKPTSDFIAFSVFVSFFPQLVAGPIERASNLLPEILSRRKLDVEWISTGLFLILLGLFKKVAIANGLAGSVDSIYNSAGEISSLDVALATIFFAVQIYCDFSGYSDIARGSAKLFGINLMRNFEQPYFSANPSEFWRRWHISLSTWLRDYLYIPLGGNRLGSFKTYRNLIITMLLGGLWHGAAWNFVLWGAYQGLALAIHRYLTATNSGLLARYGNRVPQIFYIATFFVITCYGWLLFRATSFDQIAEFTNTLFLGFDGGLSIKRPTLAAVAGIPILLTFDFYCRLTDDPYLYRQSSLARGILCAGLLFVLMMGLSNPSSQFIYFQF